ncbi:CsbD family protein [Methylobacterium organophilum]|uniref:CsbD-like domain-containing protein n=1 Tax=Methylobacterium organophilum TaxID=410 RepID=A0ABQ4TCE3_METOR|nr:CsbD family protein [Methylobacterium organophilum]UMY18690.1 CsbD family protein [Methylobacterium organophilum]GJE29370.1 hypothetical protein LKMONMHP_4250 [Methylobacterium organophilum]
MNRDRIEGGIRHIRGRGKTALGAVAGNAGRQLEGAYDQVAGAAQHAYGDARERVEEWQREGRHFVDEAVERGRDLREEAYDRGRALRDDAYERGRHYRKEASRRGRALAHRAEENKAATVLLVAAGAFSLGWLLSRRR